MIKQGKPIAGLSKTGFKSKLITQHDCKKDSYDIAVFLWQLSELENLNLKISNSRNIYIILNTRSILGNISTN